ncbi:MAG: hypothetical protein WDO14_20620 [Bacteroidota bacterium]
MRKALLTLTAIAVFMTIGRGQSFEGTIEWRTKYNITDKDALAQGEVAKKMLADPSTQENLRLLEEKMQDSAFRAKVDADPMLREKIKSALLIKASGGDLNKMMPTSVTLIIKGNNTLFTLHGGVVNNEQVLYFGDKKMEYNIEPDNKVYYLVGEEREKKGTNSITKAKETMKILNFTCNKYLITRTEDSGQAATFIYWVTEEIKGIDMSVLADSEVGTDNKLFFDEIKGVPLKIERIDSKGELLFECTSFKKEEISSAALMLPEGYKELKPE